MYHFIPPKFVSKFQELNYKPFDEISDQTFDEIKQKLSDIQSDDPVVTVGLIAYNEQDYILGTLASLAETKCSYPFEIVVVNNASTDQTREKIETYGSQVVLIEELMSLNQILVVWSLQNLLLLHLERSPCQLL